MSEKGADAFRTIGEVADELDLPQHVLRFWETKFSQIRPMKRSSGRRFYRPEDVALVRVIRDLLYGQGYTIRGVQKLLKERGARTVVGSAVAPAASQTAVDEPPPVVEAPEPLPRTNAAPLPTTVDVSRDGPSATVPASLTSDNAPSRAELLAVRDAVAECLRVLREAREV